MKKVNNLNSNLFKKFEKEQVSNLSSIIGGYEPPTEQVNDQSSSDADCDYKTGAHCVESTDWNDDSDNSTDSSREVD